MSDAHAMYPNVANKHLKQPEQKKRQLFILIIIMFPYIMTNIRPRKTKKTQIPWKKMLVSMNFT